MTYSTNQNPEQRARDNIDSMLIQAGWVVQSKNETNLGASTGVAGEWGLRWGYCLADKYAHGSDSIMG